jgi:glycosyltransferase involved in cell wall biosynthesis
LVLLPNLLQLKLDMKIVHLITGLNTGGAEMMLYKLLSTMDRDKFESIVVSLTGKGVIGNRLEEAGIPVYSLNIRKIKISVKSIWKIREVFREFKPDIIQGWMYHGNLAAQLMGKLLKNKPKIIWNIRHSLHELKFEKRAMQLCIKLGARFSEQVDRIIYNAHVSASQHENIGYSAKRKSVLPNGFNTEYFLPSTSANVTMKEELRVDDSVQIVGMVCRYHPMKGHFNFFKAAKEVINRNRRVCFVCVGRNVTEDNILLKSKIEELGLTKNIYLLGERQDIPTIMAGLDVLVLASSHGEGFPNVMGEAMSCGVLCVATDVGDSAWVLDSCGLIVRPRDSENLANGICNLLEMDMNESRGLREKARRRIVDCFSIESVTKQYENLYHEIIGD